MKPVILYRNDVDWQLEKEVAAKHFVCIHSRMLIRQDDLIIPRFSALPFFKEQEEDTRLAGARLINTYKQHLYLADLGNWVEDLRDMTPQTWSQFQDLPLEGPFILKGETNSQKYHWNTRMFARDKKEAIEIHSLLTKDSMLQYQKIYIRKYIPLERLATGLQGLPISREYRFFIYKNTILSGGFYWSSHLDQINSKVDPDEVPSDFLFKAIDRVQNSYAAPVFWVMDVAKTQSGEWIVIELNDGTMSGLSENDPETMYSNLKEAIYKDNIGRATIPDTVNKPDLIDK